MATEEAVLAARRVARSRAWARELVARQRAARAADGGSGSPYEALFGPGKAGRPAGRTSAEPRWDGAVGRAARRRAARVLQERHLKEYCALVEAEAGSLLSEEP